MNFQKTSDDYYPIAHAYIYKDVAEENYEKPSLKGKQVPNNCCLVALYKEK